MDITIPKFTVIKYLRDKKRIPTGVLVSVLLPNGDVSVNYSYCNSKTDKFNKKTGLKIAIGRALSKAYSQPPRQVMKEIEKFNDRILRYYRVNKDKLNFYGGN